MKGMFLPLLMAVLLVTAVFSLEQEELMEKVGETVVRLLAKHLFKCHLVLFTAELYSPMTEVILR